MGTRIFWRIQKDSTSRTDLAYMLGPARRSASCGSNFSVDCNACGEHGCVFDPLGWIRRERAIAITRLRMITPPETPLLLLRHTDRRHLCDSLIHLLG